MDEMHGEGKLKVRSDRPGVCLMPYALT